MTPQRSSQSKRPMMTHKQREALIQEAQNKDIFAVAQQLGMKLQGNGKAEWEGHDSFWLDRKKNRFQWYGKGLWGDPVTLVSVIKFGARSVEDYKKNYRQSIAYLTNTEVPQFDPSKIPKSQPFNYYLKDATSMQLARDYLIDVRGLSSKTVQFFEEKGVITQSVWKNKLDNGSTFTEPVVVFKHFDGNHKMLGGSVQGIEYHPDVHTDHKSGHLKRVIKNSGAYSGLAVDIGEPKRLVVCEAPIDLLSYYELHKEKLKDVKLLSSDGYKPQVLSRYVAEMYGKSDFSLSEKEKFLEKFDKLSQNVSGYPDNLITFAYDNDEAGRGFIEQFKAQYSNAEKYTVVDLPSLKADWNDELQMLKKEAQQRFFSASKGEEHMEQKIHDEDGKSLSSEDDQAQISELNEVELYAKERGEIPLAQDKNVKSEKELEKNGALQTNALETDPDIQRYEALLQEHQESLRVLSQGYQELVEQNAEMLEQLKRLTSERDLHDKNVESLSTNTKVLAFLDLPRLIQECEAKLAEVKLYVKNTIKIKIQRGLSITFEKMKIMEMLQGLQKNLECLSQKIQNFETQLKVLSGQQVDKKELLLLSEPVQKAAEEIVQRKNIKIGKSMRPQNKFEERLVQAKLKNKQIAANYAKQKAQREKMRKAQK